MRVVPSIRRTRTAIRCRRTGPLHELPNVKGQSGGRLIAVVAAIGAVLATVVTVGLFPLGVAALRSAPPEPTPLPTLARITATPTAGAVGGAALPPGQCSGPVKLIVEQFYRDGVQGGNGTPATFSTEGKRYCLTHIATYHWNDGKGAPEGGAIGVVDASGRAVGGGPWKAVATPATGGVLANWEADPTATPVVLDGVYTVVDSGPATWSWSKSLGRDGLRQGLGDRLRRELSCFGSRCS